MHQQPIGIFDSGVGGISVLKEIKRLLPDESVIYLGDSANCPYGSKDEIEAFDLAKKSIDFLISKKCKLIVIACNTVTAVAIERFRSMYPLPFVGMEPALKPAVSLTKTGKIGILATQNTFNGNLFQQTRDLHANDMELFIQPGFGLVELVENGEHNSDKAVNLLEGYLTPMIKNGADTLVLGCTHYPFFMESILKICEGRLNVIDPAAAVASQTKRLLEKNNMRVMSNSSGELVFYTTGKQHTAEKLLSFNNLDYTISCLRF